MSIYSQIHACEAWEEKLWQTALRSPPLSPSSLLKREEFKYTSSNKHTWMPMQNTLPSLLATAIFLKVMPSEVSLSLELWRVKWANNQAQRYISVRWNRCAPPWIHLIPHPPNVFRSRLFWKEEKHSTKRLHATLVGIQSPRKKALQIPWN